MDLKIIGLIFFTGLLTAGNIVEAQQVPTFKDVKVAAKIDQDNNLYTYSYKIFNPRENSGEIENVQIDISKPEGGISLSSKSLIIQRGTNRKGKMITRTFDEQQSFMNLSHESVIPVGTHPPEGWSSGLSRMHTVSWGVRANKYQILPGQSVDGFMIISRGLPSIRNMSIRPDWILTVEGYVSEEDLEKSKKIEEEIAFHGKTVGPTAPPADLIPLSFIDTIIKTKHEASSLGWIKNKGIEKSLDAKLDNAKKKLEQDLPRAAGNILSAFINEVEAQGCATYDNCPPGKHLTSEAYALLKYNAQYLIDNLK